MDNTTPDPALPTPEEIEATKKAADDFLRRVESVPESEKIKISTDKFDGPIGLSNPQSESRDTQTDDGHD